MPIVRTYRRSPDGVQSFREAWWDEETRQFVVNHGEVGKISETPVVEDDVSEEAGEDLLAAFAQQSEEDGYAELTPAEQSWVYVRFPLKGAEPGAREKSLVAGVADALTGHLAWRGLGTVEGHVYGPRRGTIHVLTPAPNKALKAIVTSVREAARSDLNKLVMAVAPGEDPHAARVRHPKPSSETFEVDEVR